MATMYEPYKTKTNENIAERKETDYKPPTSVKNTVDISNSILYNESKENNVIKIPVTDFAKS